MKHKLFTGQLDDAKITEAITRAESKTTGEIRVFVSRRACADPVQAARRHFIALGMQKTTHRNGVLIFIAPQSQTFAIYGDKAIHERCGDPFWTALRDEMIPYLKQAQFTSALVHAITRAGQLLAEHFPAKPGQHHNEQPDSVATD